MPATTPPSELRTFQGDAERALSGLRSAVGAVIDALPSRARRPAHLARLLGINRQLAWRIARAAAAADPFAIVEHLPGSAGMDIFLDAAERAGVATAMIREARTAWARYEQLIERHAGDRESFLMMARSLAHPDADDPGLHHRRQAFQGNSFIYGIQARTLLSINVLAPSSAPDKVDLALVWGFIGLRRLRPSVSWMLSRTAHVSHELRVRRPDESTSPPRLPLLEGFSSRSTDLGARVGELGHLEVLLQSGPVGDVAAMSFLFAGDPIRGVADRFRSEDDRTADLNAHIRVPAEMLIHDALVHRATFRALTPRTSVFNELHSEIMSARTRDERYRLPMDVPVRFVGPGSAAAHSPHVPRYPEMMSHICQRNGWNAEEFDLYRAVLPFPILSTDVVVSFELPERPR